MGAVLEPGSRLGRWEILRELGRGGMGVVYRARDPASGVECALKVMTLESRDDALHLERFSREVAASRSVTHGNVVCVLDAGSAPDGSPFVALELVEGGSLADRLREKGPIPPAEVVTLGIGIARALAAIHAAGIVHRDLKPANVLIGAEGEAKVADFGLARRSDASALTRTGELVGTLEYMAPEQMERAREVDPRADLYALGATLWALLVGRPPFEGSGVVLLKKHLVETPRPPSKLVAGIPPELNELILQLLAKEPHERPASATEVATRLERIGASPSRPKKSRGALAAALFVVGIGAGGGGAWWVVAGRARDGAPRPLDDAAPSTRIRPKAVVEEKKPLVVKSLRRLDVVPLGCPRALSVDFSPSERGLAALAGDESGLLWRRLSPLESPSQDRGAGQSWSVAFSPDGRHLAVATETSIQIYDTQTRKSIRTLTAHGSGGIPLPASLKPTDETRRNEVTVVRFLGDGRLASGGYDGTVRIWSASDYEPLLVLCDGASPHAHEGVVKSIAELGDGRIVTGGFGGKAFVWDLRTGKSTDQVLPEDDVYAAITSVAVAPSGAVLLGTRSGALFLWTPPAKKARTLRGPEAKGDENNHEIMGLEIVDGRWAIDASRQGILSLRDLEQPDVAKVSRGRGSIMAIAVSNDVVYAAATPDRLERFQIERGPR